MNKPGEQVGGQPLTHCPMCAYSLTGLPEDHVCPECGFDVGAVLFHSETPPMRWAVGLAGVIVAFVLSAMLVATIDILSETEEVVWAACIACLCGAVLAILSGHIRTFVAVTLDGVTFRRALGKVHSLRWEELYVVEDNEPIYRFVNGVPRHAWLPHAFTHRAVRHATNVAIATAWRERMIVKETGEPRLVYCPVCGYDLRSLPETHRCPECGFHYDPTTIVEWELHANGIVDILWILPFLLSTGLGLFLKLLGAGGMPVPWRRFEILVLMLSYGGLFYFQRRVAAKRGFLAMGEHGVTMRGIFRRKRTIKWQYLLVKSFAPLTIMERKGDELVKLRLPLTPFVRRSNGRTSLHDEFLYRWRAEQTAEQHGETEDS